MLSREVMGIACLGVVWVTAILVALAALQDLRDLRRIARLARKAIVGVATSDLAEWRVSQTGRALDASPEMIAFHDRTFESEVFASSVRVGDVAHDIAPTRDAHVWISTTDRDRAAACATEDEFVSAYAQARKAKGFARDVRVRIGKGERVHVIGEVDDQKRITPQIVSTIDPIAFCRKKALLLALFVPIELVVCAAATAVAFVPPHFGRVSIAGAVACFAFFLGVTPIAVALRENARRPHEAFLRTQWTKPTASHAQPLTQR
jgi:hypothetical protein